MSLTATFTRGRGLLLAAAAATAAFAGIISLSPREALGPVREDLEP